MSNGKVGLELTNGGQVARINLAAPKANILDSRMILDLFETLNSLNWDGRLKLVLLGSEGPHFSFGASVEEHLPDQISRTLAQLRELLHAMLVIPAPTMAVVRGQCLGGGFELALACDLMIAEESAQFGLPEIKLGVFPPAGAALLPLRVGASRAAELVLTGGSWTAAQAHEAGLVHRVFATGELLNGAETWLESDFLPRSGPALRYAAQAARRPLVSAVNHELPLLEELYLKELMRQPEAVEGLLAFLEKRRPRWISGAA